MVRHDVAGLARSRWVSSAHRLLRTRADHAIGGGHKVVGAPVILAWLEWSSRCEDRSLVNKVTAAVVAAGAATLTYQHERRQREAEQRQQQDAYWAAQRADSERRMQEQRQYQADEQQYSREAWQHMQNPDRYPVPQTPVPPPHRDWNALDYGSGHR